MASPWGSALSSLSAGIDQEIQRRKEAKLLALQQAYQQQQMEMEQQRLRDEESRQAFLEAQSGRQEKTANAAVAFQNMRPGQPYPAAMSDQFTGTPYEQLTVRKDAQTLPGHFFDLQGTETPNPSSPYSYTTRDYTPQESQNYQLLQEEKKRNDLQNQLTQSQLNREASTPSWMQQFLMTQDAEMKRLATQHGWQHQDVKEAQDFELTKIEQEADAQAKLFNQKQDPQTFLNLMDRIAALIGNDKADPTLIVPFVKTIRDGLPDQYQKVLDTFLNSMQDHQATGNRFLGTPSLSQQPSK